MSFDNQNDFPPSENTKSKLIERKLVSILSADVAGYSRLMAENEEETLKVFRSHRKVFASIVEMHKGRIFNTAGDAILAEFNSAVEAVRCATEIQSALRTRNDKMPVSRQVMFRIGVNLGDVIIQGEDLLGDGVNIAARLQAAAEPGGVCISGSIFDQIQNKLSLAVENMGEQNFKNIPHAVRTFSIKGTEGHRPLPHAKPAKLEEKGKIPPAYLAVGIAASLIFSVGAVVFYFSSKKPAELPPVAQTSTPVPVQAPAQAPQPLPVQPIAQLPAPSPAVVPAEITRAYEKTASAPKPAQHTVSVDISDAISKAAPGDVIELKPGTYKEHLSLSKNIVLRGQPGADGKIGVRIEWSGSETVDVFAGNARLENLVIVLTPEAAAKSPAAILLRGGKLELFNVYAFGAGVGSSALSIREGSSVAEKSEFSGTRGIEQLAGSFECVDCVASGNKDEGAVFYNQAGSPTFKTSLRNFRAERNGLNGVAVMAKAKAFFEGCTIKENGVNGVLVNGDGVGTFRGCDVSENREHGLVATDDGRIEFINSQASKNIYSGLAAILRSKLVMRKSEFAGNGEFGFALLDQATAVDQENKIAGNRGGKSYRVPASSSKP